MKLQNISLEHMILQDSALKKTEVESKVRTLYQSEIIQTDEGFDYVVTGSGFLYNMVRVLVAFLIEVGKGKRHASEVSTLLNEK